MGNETAKGGKEQIYILEKGLAEIGVRQPQEKQNAVVYCTAYTPKIFPKTKMIVDLQKKQKRASIGYLQNQILTRILRKENQKKQILKDQSKVLSLQDCQLSENEQKMDYLMLIEEQIDQLIKEKTQRGEVISQQMLDRSKLFKKLDINLASFIRKRGQNVREFYDFKQVLGQGSYGKVYRAICKSTKEERAIKVLKCKIKSKNDKNQQFLAQFDLLSTLDHPNIVKLYQIFFYKGNYYVVMQFCKGGTLIDLIKKNNNISEKTMMPIMKQLLSALAYLDANNIVHRDIKLDNIVVLGDEDQNGDYSIKIIDFGTAVKISKKKKNKSIAGTRYYMAAQAFKGILTPKSDIFSSGVIFYILFQGKFPFQGDSLQQMERNVNNQLITFGGHQWSNISQEAKNLLLLMLQKNYEKRVSAVQALNHQWFKKAKSGMKIVYGLSDLINLERYQRGNNFIAVIQNFLSNKQISQVERDRLGRLFRQIDTNNDGTIQYSQLVSLCHSQFGVETQVEVKKILSEIDQNDSGRIDFNQFLVAMFGRKKLFLEESLIEAFRFYDMNKNGFLERGELLHLLSGCQNEELEYLLKQLDIDGDNQISLEQFLAYMNQRVE